MIKGHLEQLLIMAAFSIDMESAGSPSLHHWAFFDSVVRIFIGVTPSVIGMLRATISGNQVLYQSSSLNLEVKAPM